MSKTALEHRDKLKGRALSIGAAQTVMGVADWGDLHLYVKVEIEGTDTHLAIDEDFASVRDALEQLSYHLCPDGREVELGAALKVTFTPAAMTETEWQETEDREFEGWV